MGTTKLTRSHRRYRQLRARVRRDQPLCAHCAAHGLTVAGTDVDHIIPLAHGGRLMDRANLQHLCAACHDQKTRQQQGGNKVPAACRQDTRRLRMYTRVTSPAASVRRGGPLWRSCGSAETRSRGVYAGISRAEAGCAAPVRDAGATGVV